MIVTYILLALSLFLGFLVFRMGYRDGDWHWGAALAAACVPFAFTLVLSIIGFIVAIAYTVAIWKATSI